MALDYDKILLHLGELGRWNAIMHLLIWMPSFIAGAMVLVYSFTGNLFYLLFTCPTMIKISAKIK